jgi:carboxyl-terminal processing protease
MSIKSRDLLTVILICVLGLVAFTAGYLARDLFRFPAQDGEFSVFWEAWERVEQSYIGEIPNSRQMTYGAVRGAISVLNDPYTIFVEPAAREQEKVNQRGTIGGVGATLHRDEEGRIILMPIADNPAELAGLLEGDILVAVDGEQITAEMTVEEIVQNIRGEEGTEVILTVLHPGSTEESDIAIVRAVILLPSVSSRLLDEDPNIGYIRLSRFSAESSGEIRQAVIDLKDQGAQKMILDLRQNVGGLLDAAVNVSDHFLDSGPIVYQISKLEEERVFNATSETVARGIPLAVLVDGGTASSAEIVAGALQDRDRAVLIGTTTFGKGSVQLVYDLSDGSSVHVTSARWHTPNRHQIDQKGLQPNIFVEQSPESLEEGIDDALNRAISYLQGL